jgi:predicted nucleic acid-binding protein
VRATLVDTNVLFDYLSQDPDWFDWAATTLSDAADAGLVVINPVIYAEMAVRYARIEDLDQALPADYFIRADVPWEAAFLAAHCFARYKKRGGVRQSPPPDFFIGAHAAVSGMDLLTRDARRFRTYFPKVRLIAP